jgi:hypothetical protein
MNSTVINESSTKMTTVSSSSVIPDRPSRPVGRLDPAESRVRLIIVKGIRLRLFDQKKPKTWGSASCFFENPVRKAVGWRPPGDLLAGFSHLGSPPVNSLPRDANATLPMSSGAPAGWSGAWLVLALRIAAGVDGRHCRGEFVTVANRSCGRQVKENAEGEASRGSWDRRPWSRRRRRFTRACGREWGR